MTLKERSGLDAAWKALQELCESKGRFVSAGEFAKHFGVARNTGFKIMLELLDKQTIEYRQAWRGNVSCYTYGIAGIDGKKAQQI